MAEHNTRPHLPLETRDAPQISLSLLAEVCQLLHSFQICFDLFSLALGQGAALTKGILTSLGFTAPSTQPVSSLKPLSARHPVHMFLLYLDLTMPHFSQSRYVSDWEHSTKKKL